MSDYSIAVKVTGDAKNFEQTMASVARKLESIGNKMQSVGKGISGVGKALMPVTAALGAVTAGAAKTTMSFIKLYESTMIVFEKMLGSKDAANDLYTSLLDIAKASTFSQETFLAISKSLVGAGMSAEMTEKSMQALTDAVSAFGGTSEQLEQAGYAWRKMAISGKVSMEELNMLNDSGVQGLKILANQYGKTTDEMRKLISKGAIPADEAMEKLIDGIENGTDGVNGHTQALKGMAAAMKGKTLTGALDSLKTSIRSFSLSLLAMNPTLKASDEGYAENQKRIRQLTASVVTITKIIPLLSKVFAGLTDAIGTLLDKLVGANVVFNEATGEWENVGGILGDLQNKLETMDPEKLRSIGNIILAVGAAAPILYGLGKAITFIGSALQIISKIHPVIAIITAVAAAVAYLWKTNEVFRESLKGIIRSIGSSLQPILVAAKIAFVQIAKAAKPALDQLAPVILMLAATFGKLMEAVAPVVTKLIIGLAPVIAKIVAVIGQLMAALAPIIGSLISSLLPAIEKIIGAIGTIITALGPALVNIFTAIGLVIEALAPVINNIAKIVAVVIAKIIEIVTPIIVFIAQVIAQIIVVVTGIIAKVAEIFNAVRTIITNVWDGIKSFIGSTITVIGGVISRIVGPVQTAFNRVKSIVTGVFKAIQNAWSGLTSFVSNIVSGIVGAFENLVSTVKSVINTVIRGINAAIGVINKIPGVTIGKIPQLYRGTDDWQGGFAAINEGGRGEIVYLPGGTQVIPHDVSMKYAREAASVTTTGGQSIDPGALRQAIMEGIMSLTGPLQAGMKQAVDGMGVNLNKREIGRIVEVK